MIIVPAVEYEKLKAKVKTKIKTEVAGKVALGEIYFHMADDKFVTVTVETNCPEFVQDVISFMVYKSDRWELVSTTIDPGQYDWGADYYIKDSVSLVISI